MRILQLIDTLNPGGAERMALNYYLALKNEKIFSCIVITREKGLLSKEIDKDSTFHFLAKKNRYDLRALFALKRIIHENSVEVVNAHGSSWFFAVLCKLLGCKFKLVWHDHYGNSQFLDKRNLQPLKFFSRYIDGIICVNEELKSWGLNRLGFKKKIIFLPNFILKKSKSKSELKGNSEVNIVCTANFRPQKNHIMLLEAFDKLNKKFSVALHLFGVDFQDDYSEKIKSEITKISNIYYYGEVENIIHFLNDADIGVLPSNSEGFPLALMEYGMAELAVVSSNVGYCRMILGEFGKLINPNQIQELIDCLSVYIKNKELRSNHGTKLKDRIEELYSEDSVIKNYLKFIKKI
uniref:glycosyltransferase family 4 protein n=1 Tax=uncultured Christiangramia sp. TaxID=503836 RepID=UPI002627A2F8|nr:glycosyltransferase family 4 protein [uncultured Christiangramia sp.]